MGIAILLVLIYHAMCVTYNPLRTLNIGYVGVDIFLIPIWFWSDIFLS